VNTPAVAARASPTERSPDLRIRRAGAGNQSSRSTVRLYDAGLHNRSRNRARNWVHSRIWRSRDYFLSTPPTRKTAIVPFLRLSLSDGTSYGSPARTDDCGHLLLLPRHDLSKRRGALKAIFGGRRTTDTRTPRAATEAAASSEATALPQFSLKCANFPPKKALHRVDDIGKVAFEEREQ
jgi:hypothetical protein